MSRVASGKESLTDLLLRLYPPIVDLRSAFDAALSPAGMPDGEGDEEDDDDGSDDGDDDADSSGDDSSGGEADVIKDPEKKKLSDEAAKHRTRANAEKIRADKFEAELRKIQDKDKSELEKTQRDLEEAVKERDALKEEVRSMKVSVEFSLKHASKFRDAEAALTLLERKGEFSVNDDGEVEGMDSAVSALLKSKPYLAQSEGDVEDDKLPPSGDTNNGKRNKGEKLQREQLAKKFPALRR